MSPKNSKNKCERCAHSVCCRYITQQIDTPRSMYDFDILLWQLAHRDVQLFQDERGWFLLVNNPCLHLTPEGKCGIYAKRPGVCRDHSSEGCEFGGETEEVYQRFFPDYESLERYCRQRFKTWQRRHAA